MSEFEHDPFRKNRGLEQGKISNVIGTVIDFAGVVVDSVKNGAVGAAHMSTTMLHISTDVLRLDRKE